ncbi:hypothetical protein Tel_11875 [Candidatus Tenderia electrophaga]|jgi:uncharacterized membrane protein|uniref:DUF2231 domain-containing protein n=1 Tax=Candidatus Tenderia electrophaga TaxID=1748243 RepID=A0A0S2TFB1_9GAMM|nr:hypothetical protein Tel_11875 [Candidatus Tenderia electrophaga]
MVEIIPNWHPIFVHFTVALLSLATGLFVVTPFIKSPLKEQWQIVARWALWFGAGFTIVTGLAGLYAYNTVAHDTPSHAAMTDHRNWAIAAITIFLVMAIWSAVRVRRKQALGAVFIAAMVIAGGVLASTAWRGGEVVYRYGLGVMSLPKAEGEGHAHEHADGGGHGHASETSAASGAVEMAKEHHEEEDSHGTDHAREDQAMTNMDVANGGATAQPKDRHDDGHEHEH